MIRVSIKGNELQEYLLSQTAAEYAIRKTTEATAGGDPIAIEAIRNHIRESFRLNRFAVMNWLVMNGVKIPTELLDDRTHPEVGAQMPDELASGLKAG
jgi:hypothetical protein